MLSVRVNLRDYKRLTRDLEAVSTRAFPHASRNALNAMAFEGRKLWQAEMGSKFVLRNSWTVRRILVDKARGVDMASMRAVLFSPDEYLIKQEQGGESDHSVPTGIATGEGRGANPRRKLVRKPNQVSAIALGQRYHRGNRRQRNAVAIHAAAAEGRKFVFLDLEKRKGLFKLTGGRRSPRVDMVWDTTKKSHHIHPTPTLGPALQRLEVVAPRLMEGALIEQLKRAKAFGY